MALSKKPINGMKDILPREAEIRDYVQSVIIDTYKSYGFSHIETPAMESIANLTSNQGGDNEKLIFKVLKRGAKLNLETAKVDTDVSDMGMRYDLTLPLSRFYAANESTLGSPFKAIQIGSVWRADRPQRGRYRQFSQCDIDILGDPSNLAEIELILATTKALSNLNFKGFLVRINDRRILKAMASCAGFNEDEFGKLFIILDKLDKIGFDGVRAELLESGFVKALVDNYLSLFEAIDKAETFEDKTDALCNLIGDSLLEEYRDIIDQLREIASSVNVLKEADFELVFDPTLVRGMNYYTGAIFEIAIPEFGGSCGGGGRYDNMVGNFSGGSTPACGFSIGFERIILLLLESGFEIPEAPKKTAYLLEKGYSTEKLNEVMAEANKLRAKGQVVSVLTMKKNKKHQKEGLAADGYDEIIEVFNR